MVGRGPGIGKRWRGVVGIRRVRASEVNLTPLPYPLPIMER